MIRIAIDGACRRNGKPDCVSAGACVVQYLLNGVEVSATESYAVNEASSTNQRGELLALLLALQTIKGAEDEVLILTDSEYIFNAMTKQWYRTWRHYNWKGSTGDTVKNADLWQKISDAADELKHEVIFYHIKGHCIPFGAVTADRLLQEDADGGLLYAEVLKKYDEVYKAKQANLKAAQDLSERNNGFKFPDQILREFVALNVVVDAVATAEVNVADVTYNRP